MADDFDPDAYLEGKKDSGKKSAASSFDPDAYLSSKSDQSKRGLADSAYDSISAANDSLYKFAGVKKLPGSGPIPDPGLLLPMLFGPGMLKTGNALESANSLNSLVRITKANSEAPILYGAGESAAGSSIGPLARRAGEILAGGAVKALKYIGIPTSAAAAWDYINNKRH